MFKEADDNGDGFLTFDEFQLRRAGHFCPGNALHNLW
jgi:hypothetical protein